MQFDVTFTFQGTRAEVDLIVNRIIENFEPLAVTEPEELADEDMIETEC